MRLIDAAVLPVVTLTDGGYWMKDVVYKSDVDVAPTIDAVEVVRCKDCKHFGGVIYGETCRLHSYGNTRVCMRKDDFCSRGERRCS